MRTSMRAPLPDPGSAMQRPIVPETDKPGQRQLPMNKELSIVW